eukprot:2219780-Rhodomonas_salina.2
MLPPPLAAEAPDKEWSEHDLIIVLSTPRSVTSSGRTEHGQSRQYPSPERLCLLLPVILLRQVFHLVSPHAMSVPDRAERAGRLGKLQRLAG